MIKNKEKLFSYLNSYGYLRINQEESHHDINEIRQMNDLIIFQSSKGLFWLVKENKYLNLVCLEKEVNIFEQELDFGMIRTYNEFVLKLTDIVENLGLFSRIIGTKKVICWNYIYNIKYMNFDLLADKYNLSFVISNAEPLNGKVLETKDKVYIIHEIIVEKSDLYYKYAYLRAQTTKEIRIIGIRQKGFLIELGEYSYTDYNFVIRKSEKFLLNNFRIDRKSFTDTIKGLETINSFEIFPQADNFDLIWRVFDTLSDKKYSKDELSIIIEKTSGGMVDRQISYYLSAMFYLDLLIESIEGYYSLSTSAIGVKDKNLNDQIEFLAKSILKHEIFNKAFMQYLKFDSIPEKKKIVEIVNDIYTQKLTESTVSRRASTVRSWLKWIISNLY